MKTILVTILLYMMNFDVSIAQPFAKDFSVIFNHKFDFFTNIIPGCFIQQYKELSNGYILAACEQKGVYLIDFELNAKLVINKCSTGIWGLATNSIGDIYVACKAEPFIYKYNKVFELIKTIALKTNANNLEVTQDDHLIACSEKSHEILYFDKYDVAFDRINTSCGNIKLYENDLYVTDSEKRIRRYGRFGQKSIDTVPWPHGFDIDINGNILVSSFDPNKLCNLILFNRNLEYLKTIFVHINQIRNVFVTTRGLMLISGYDSVYVYKLLVP